MGCRMNQKSLTPAQRAAFANAVLALKNKVPSQLGLSNRYDDYVQTHMNSMMATPGGAHQGPTFEPWHRERGPIRDPRSSRGTENSSTNLKRIYRPSTLP